MATVNLETLIDDIETRLTLLLTGEQILDRLDNLRESPKLRQHKGIRVFPVATDVEERYAQTALVRIVDTIDVETFFRITRNADDTMDNALLWERQIREALTDDAWYRDRDSNAATGDDIEVHYEGTTRQKIDSALEMVITFSFTRDATLGG